jgi:hypothetical protein
VWDGAASVVTGFSVAVAVGSPGREVSEGRAGEFVGAGLEQEMRKRRREAARIRTVMGCCIKIF